MKGAVNKHISGITLWVALAAMAFVYVLDREDAVWLGVMFCWIELIHIRIELVRNRNGDRSKHHGIL